MKADLDRYLPAAFGGALTFGGIRLSRLESSSLVRHLGGVQAYRANARLISEGDRLDRPKLIRSGWASRVRFLSDGRRQILNYYLPGDVMGFSPDPEPVALATYASLTRLMTVDLAVVRTLVLARSEEFPELAAVWRRMRTHEEFYLLSQITRMGRQKAYERVAHLLLEFHARLKRTGLAEGYTFQLPLTQESLADGLGLSAVHVNRTFKLLKRKNYIRVDRTTITLLEPSALVDLAGYRDPSDLASEDMAMEGRSLSMASA